MKTNHPRRIATSVAPGFILRAGRATRHPAIALLLCVGCGTAPSVSADKVAQFSEAFAEYAVAVKKIKARLDAADPGPPESKALASVSADLGIVAEALDADASNVKTSAVAERVEKVGSAVASIPHPFAKVAGYGLSLLALGGAMLFTRKKPTLPSKES